ILAFATCAGDTPCTDTKDRVVAAIRRLADGTTAVGTLSLRTGAFVARFESGSSALGETEQFIDDNAHALPMVGTRDLAFASLDESIDSPPDIVVSSRADDPAQRLGILNSNHKGSRQLNLQNLEWASEGFGRGRALLAMPIAGSTSSTRLVVHIYWSFAGYSREPFEQYDGGAAAWRPLVTEGDFAVLVPEVPIPSGSSRGGACSQVAMRVDEAIEHAVVAIGLPRDRIGLYGYSWGGYLANCLAARSASYSAIVSGAGFSDMFGFCLNESLCMSAPRTLGLPKAPWLAMDEFVAESPAFSAHTVQAPMLLQFGSADGELLQFQMREMFYALQIAGKRAQLNIYEGRDHSTTVTHPEYWPRTIEWLGRHLRN
ncbi:MAG TPA: prolyl oligopeptidase family serine peptidase, partial [Vicinamibacterales bacterium]